LTLLKYPDHNRFPVHNIVRRHARTFHCRGFAMRHSIARSFRAARLFVGACLVGAASMAHAGLVTVDENGMDRILAQAGIYVRVAPSETLYRNDLLQLDYQEFVATVPTVFRPGPVPIYFIDAFVADGTYIGAGTVGMGWVGAGGLAVASSVAADAARGATLLAHELGHNLGLVHDDSSNDLMYPILYPDARSLLSSAQVALMQASGLLQTDAAGKRFIEILPIAVLAEAPEPAAALLVLAGLGAMAWMRRRRA
jgi:hypothetical protein